MGGKSRRVQGVPGTRPPSEEEIRKRFPPTPSRWSSALERVNRDGTTDGLRREVLKEFARLTGRSAVVYATAFHIPAKAPLANAQLFSLGLSDIAGLREVTADLPPGPLDLILHTPGGSAEAAEGVVRLLRAKFSDVRVLVPLAAKSAGTMLAMSANSIVALAGAELGPIDPQFVVQGRFAPAKAIENQFARAAIEIVGDPRRIPAWVPLLSALGPSLLEECRKALELSKGLVRTWLRDFMFGGDADADNKAVAVADYLSDYEKHLSHGRRIGVEELAPYNVKIAYASAIDPKLDDLFAQLWTAIDLTFVNSATYKMFENDRGQGIFNAATIELKGARP